MKTYNATEFKAKCLRILERLNDEGVVVTKRGKPIARVLPFKSRSIDDLYGCMGSKVRVHGDVFSTGVTWNAEP
jgi:prevent-host-death family protein